MSYNKEQEQAQAQEAYGDPQEWAGQYPPPPPHMMHYYGYPYPGQPMHPHGNPMAHMHPAYMHHPHAQHMGYGGHMPPPHIHPGYPPGYWHGQHPGEYQMPPAPPQEDGEGATNPLMEQAQAMLEGALGEEAGIFKELLGTLGMNDKEFWKGAMVGAAAALLLSNENVRNNLKNLVAGAGGMLKSGGESVKDGATQAASSVKQNVTTGSEIFKDTYNAGKEGFKESVERHQAPQVTAEAEAPVEQAPVETAPNQLQPE